jgi:hypothetical protein
LDWYFCGGKIFFFGWVHSEGFVRPEILGGGVDLDVPIKGSHEAHDDWEQLDTSSHSTMYIYNTWSLMVRKY